MNKTKKAAMLALTGALTVGGAFAAFADNQGTGQWCNGAEGHAADTTWQNADGQTVSSWWFAVSPDGKNSLANTWHWIKGSDGSMYCYYFDKDGWLVVDGTVDGSSVDGAGRYVTGGQPEAGDESKTYYTASVSFLASAGGSSNNQSSGTQTQTTTEGNKTVTGNNTSETKVNSKGETPDAAQVEFKVSDVSGTSSKTVTNDWANFTMTLSGFSSVESGDGNSYMDFLAYNDTGEISVQYYPLDFFTAGNTSFDAFVTSYMGSKKPGALESDGTFKSAALAGDKEFGGYTWKQINRTYGIPIKKTADYATYLRQVEGTNYVMELYTKNDPNSFSSILGSMQKVR
ncbi:MAG: hypothetical protein Q4C63_08280 [Eubacteriales bacterium]|nr:hypothetical protein [Eubacteriales bacterium]